MIGEKPHEFELLLKARAGDSFTFTKRFALKFNNYILTMTKQYSYELLAVSVRYEFKFMGIAVLD